MAHSEAISDVLAPKPSPIASDADAIVEGELFATYELDHNHPFLAHYLDIHRAWHDQRVDYKVELDTVNTFLMDEVEAEVLDNSTRAVFRRLKQLEKGAGVSINAPARARARQLAAYINYLQAIKAV